MAGSSHGHTPAAWTGVTIAFIGFCVSGAFMVMAQPAGFWAGLVVVVLGGVVGWVMRGMGLGQPKEAHQRARRAAARAGGRRELTRVRLRGGATRGAGTRAPGPPLTRSAGHNATRERRQPEGDATAAGPLPRWSGWPSPPGSSRPSPPPSPTWAPWTRTSPATTPPARCCSYTGLYCPGCGGLRSAHAFVHGDFLAALQDNALAVVGYLALRRAVDRLGGPRGRAGDRCGSIPGRCSCGAVGALLLVFTVVRNLPFGGWLHP